VILNARSDDDALLVYGAGGHGRVVAEAAEASGWNVLGFLDDIVPIGSEVGAWRVVDKNDPLFEQIAVIVAIGDNGTRARIGQSLLDAGRTLASVMHPTAWVSPSARLGAGVFIGAAACINAESLIDDGVIINTGAIVEHDNRLGPWVHIAPRAVLGGHVTIGARSLIAIGSVVRPGINIGTDVTLGAGAVAVSDLANGVTAVGVPARVRA